MGKAAVVSQSPSGVIKIESKRMGDKAVTMSDDEVEDRVRYSGG
jgi:hypothetical protein